MITQNNIIKLIIITATICLLAIIFYQLYPLIHEVIVNVHDESKTIDYVMAYGKRGIPVLISIATLQYFVLVIPTPAIGILSGLCYGTVWGIVILTIGHFIGNTIIFLLIRHLSGIIHLHTKHINKHKSKYSELLSIKQLDNLRKPWVIVFLLSMIPLMPNILISYFFAQSKILAYKFVLASVMGSIPAAAAYSFLGNHLSDGNLTKVIAFASILLILITITYIFKDKILKKILHHGII